jgi:hypothetical protein
MVLLPVSSTLMWVHSNMQTAVYSGSWSRLKIVIWLELDTCNVTLCSPRFQIIKGQIGVKRTLIWLEHATGLRT